MFAKLNVTNLKDNLRDYAGTIGLPIYGIASAEPLKNLEVVLENRKKEGLESPFESKWQPQERCHPELQLPSVKSIVCVGMPYYPEPSKGFSLPETVPIPWGIAGFAKGRDYHHLLRDKLELLVDYLKLEVGSELEYVVGVDTIPLVERAFAYRAGLGWYGKNNLLLNPHYGSWFLLGELLTNIPFEPDSPLDLNCGSCELCVNACPTGALSPSCSTKALAPSVTPEIIESGGASKHHFFDSRKCISCLTQWKKEVPLEMWGKVGRTVFGCDLCQEVCPQNKIADGDAAYHEAHPEAHNYKSAAAWEALSDIFYLSDAEFQSLYGTSGFGWAGKELLQRNGALALGANGQEKYIPALKRGLDSSSNQVRKCSEWALSQLKKGF